MEVTFLNDKFTESLIDFSLSTDGKFPHAVRKGFGEKDKDGNYSAYEYTVPVSNLKQARKVAALVSIMGGQIDDKYNYDKYSKADLLFTSIEEGWKGYQKEINQKNELIGIERLKQTH